MRLAAILLALIAPSVAACARFQTTQMHTVCIRYIDSEGYLRGYEALFNTSGANRAIKEYRWAYRGQCKPQDQTQRRRVKVCLAASSRCAEDRTTLVWEDQVDMYFKKYPGSYHGACKEEKPDTCSIAVKIFKQPPPKKLKSRRQSTD